MEFQDVVDRRRMVRDFSAEPVPAAVIDRALRNATRAPSAGFTQGWGFLVLDTAADVRRWWELAAGPERLAAPDRWLTGMMRAPVLVVPCSSETAYITRYAEPDKGREGAPWHVPYWHMDTAMAALLILQTVVDEGLGGCFFGIPVPALEAVREGFGIPSDHDPIGVIAIGHPAGSSSRSGGARTARGSPSRRPRRPMSDLVHRGRWSA